MTDKIITQCEHCSKKYRLNAAKFAGKRIKCPNCAQPIRVAEQPEPEQAASNQPEPAPVQPQPVQPQSPAQKPQPAPSAQPQTVSARKSWKRKAFTAAAALVLIFLYTYWTNLRAWYVEAIPGETRIIVHPENKTRELARKVMDKLKLSSSEKKNYDQVVNSYVQQGIPRTIPWPRVSKDQERVIHYHCKEAHWKTNALLKENEKNIQDAYRKIIDQNKSHQVLLAYHWKNEEKFYKLWVNSWLTYLNDHSCSLTDWKELELLKDISYIRRNNLSRFLGLNALTATAFKNISEKSNAITTRSDAMHLIFASYMLGKTGYGQELFTQSSEKLFDRSLPWGTLRERAEGLKYLMEYMVLKKRDGNRIDPGILRFGERLSQEIAILIEPDGCLPQISGVSKRINRLETIYWASRIYDRDDFRFIAYSGIRMPDAYPPSVRSVYLENRNLCVMRSNWNICRFTHKNNDQWLGRDAVSLTADLKTGEFSIFGNNHPQLIMRYENYGRLLPDQTEWKTEPGYNFLSFETDTLKNKIYFLRNAHSWIIRTEYKGSKKPGRKQIYFYRSHVAEKADNCIEADHYKNFIMFHHNHYIKQQGRASIKLYNSKYRISEVEPELEGCYWKAQISGNKERELIITALPLLPDYGENYDRRNLTFYDVKKQENNEYSIFTYKMTYKKPINCNTMPTPTKPKLLHRIQISGNKVAVVGGSELINKQLTQN